MTSYMGKWREKYKGTVTYFENSSWDNMNKAASNGKYPQKHRFSYKKGIRINMTRAEFSQWCLKMQDVIEGLYRSGEKPCLRRIDSSKHFTVDNIVVGTPKSMKLGAVARNSLPKKRSKARMVKDKVSTFLKGLFK
jgi:hypothetical protein